MPPLYPPSPWLPPGRSIDVSSNNTAHAFKSNHTYCGKPWADKICPGSRVWTHPGYCKVMPIYLGFLWGAINTPASNGSKEMTPARKGYGRTWSCGISYSHTTCTDSAPCQVYSVAKWGWSICTWTWCGPCQPSWLAYVELFPLRGFLRILPLLLVSWCLVVGMQHGQPSEPYSQ